ncbi:hypothetical protein ACFZDM_01855 [Streptomyces californicus]|uniref:hypothetical protein n=1 Tax=Streptomyces californicus TaxID=67351 RepID=UPI0036ECF484
MSPTEPDLIRAEFDLCRQIPSLVDLRTAVRGNDWDTVEAYFDFLGDDEDERAVAAGLVADLSSSERFLEREVAAHGSPLAVPCLPPATSTSAGTSAARTRRNTCRVSSSSSSTAGCGGPSSC